jgi:hypothetical protein
VNKYQDPHGELHHGHHHEHHHGHHHEHDERQQVLDGSTEAALLTTRECVCSMREVGR